MNSKLASADLALEDHDPLPEGFHSRLTNSLDRPTTTMMVVGQFYAAKVWPEEEILDLAAEAATAIVYNGRTQAAAALAEEMRTRLAALDEWVARH